MVSGNLGEPLSKPHGDYTLGVNRTNLSGYLEHNLLLNDLTISAGLVVVRNTWSDMNTRVYPGIDISYRPNNYWKLHASYNTSLRMPSFTEMYYKVQGYQADPHLKPEEMQAIEGGATFSTLSFKASATVWRHFGRNMIDWIMDTSLGSEAVWQSVNHTKINSTGVETSVAFSVGANQFNIDYSYIHQQKEQEAHIVSQYALEYLRHKLTAKANIPLSKRLTLGLHLRYQDREGQYTDFDGKVYDYEPYALLDTRLTWQQNNWKVYAEANNLFDKDYRDFGLVKQPGRWIIIGASVRL